MIRSTLAAGLLLAALVASNANAADKTVTIGIVTATSGPLAAPGKFQLNGFQLAADTINAAGGVKVGAESYKIALKVYDTRCNAAEGASAMQRLATIDEVPVVMGEVCSPVAAAEAPVAADFSIPMITTVPTAANLTTQGNKFFFRINAHNGQLNQALSDFVLSEGLTPLAFIAWNNDAGRGGVDGMKALLKDPTKTAYVGYFNVGEVDFSAHIANIRNSGAKAVMLFMDEEPGALAIRQIRDAGLKIQLVGTLAMGSDRFLNRLNAKYLDGMVQYDAFPPNAPIERIRKFSEAYKARFKEESHGFAAQSYDALQAAALAMTAAGSATDGAKIRDALAKISFEGIIGPIRFDQQGQAAPPVYVTQWCENGTRKVRFPVAMASACGEG